MFTTPMSVTTDALLPADVATSLLDPRAHAEPDRIHTAYSWARANNPLGIAQVEGFDPFWAVTKHADIMEVGRNSANYSNAARSAIAFPSRTIEHFIAMAGKPNSADTLIALDDPQHRQLRGLTQGWFMPGSLLKLDERIRAIARASVAKLRDHGGECEFVADLALHYPLRVVMEILGVPAEDEPLMLRLTQEILAPQDPELSRNSAAAVDPIEQAKQLGAVIADFARYFAGITADRLKNPRNDIATVLANAQIDGQALDDGVRASYYMVVATAGHDTTSSSTATAMWALARDPALLARLKAEPKLIGGFVDEAIRWGTPVRHFMRTALVDTELRGRHIRRGDWLMLCYASGNRDEEVFERPFDFVIDRASAKHVAFGYGTHVCLGQHLARMEMRLLFEELVPRLEALELAGDMPLSASNFISGPKRLPIRYRLN